MELKWKGTEETGRRASEEEAPGHAPFLFLPQAPTMKDEIVDAPSYTDDAVISSGIYCCLMCGTNQNPDQSDQSRFVLACMSL